MLVAAGRFPAGLAAAAERHPGLCCCCAHPAQPHKQRCCCPAQTTLYPESVLHNHLSSTVATLHRLHSALKQFCTITEAVLLLPCKDYTLPRCSASTAVLNRSSTVAALHRLHSTQKQSWTITQAALLLLCTDYTLPRSSTDTVAIECVKRMAPGNTYQGALCIAAIACQQIPAGIDIP